MVYERNTTQLAIALFAENEHGLVVAWFSAISMEQTDGDGQLLCVTVYKKGAMAVRTALMQRGLNAGRSQNSDPTPRSGPENACVMASSSGWCMRP